jgi:hypothetical protein
MRKSADVLLVMHGGYSYSRTFAAPGPEAIAWRMWNLGHARIFGTAGVIAQLGERFNGIEEVGGSIPPGSTNKTKCLAEKSRPLLLWVSNG